MIRLVGVAHVLDLRVRLTHELRAFQPKAIAIELDPDRLRTLQERAQGDSKASRGGPIMFRMWANVQDRLASELGDVPGSEMLTAIDVAKELGTPLFLVDDPFREVAPRLLRELTVKERVQLMISSVFALFVPAKVVTRQLQSYDEGREEYLQVMREQFPTVTRVLLDERNLHMAGRLAALGSQFERVAAVVGDAHVKGLEDLLRPRAEVSVAHLLGPT